VGDEISLSVQPTTPPISAATQRIFECCSHIGILDWHSDVRAESLIELPHKSPTRIEFEEEGVDIGDETIFQVTVDRKGATAIGFGEDVPWPMFSRCFT